MAEGPIYGASSGDWRDAIRRMQESGRSNDEMRQKEEQRQQVEERGQSLDRTSAGVRTQMSDTTATLTERLTANATAIERETAALQTNVALMRQAVSLRREMSQLPVSASERASSSIAAGGAAAGRVAPERASAPRVAGGLAGAGVVADPNAAAQLSEAQRRLAAAEIAAQQARSEVGRVSRAAGSTPQQVAPLVAQREVANQELQSARSGLRAAQTNVDLQTQINTQRARELETLRQINAADERTRLEAQQQAAQASSFIERTQGTVAGRTVLPTSRGPIALLPASTPTAAERIDQRIASQGAYFSAGGGRSGAPTEEVSGEQAAYNERVRSAAQGLSGLADEQSRANRAFQFASASYADASNALSRHGALTTEFIQALARGEVTLAEFGSQVTTTIGKFGGWAIAGAAVYGVYDALKHVYDGARDTQGAVQNLSRFLPGLGGPAGGGTGQIGYAQSTVRNISTQFNVPISEVSDAMQVMARTFHSVADAGDATRAALAAYRLDQVPLTQSEQYLVGIANTMSLGGSGTIGVVNSLNQLQATYGVRVQQSLPGLARAVPAAQASGVSLPQLESLVGLGVRAGVSGNQIGTALVRSMTNFAFRPGNAPIFGQFGIEPRIGQYGDLIGQVMRTIDRRVATGTLTGRDLTAMATALGGPQLGGRSILPILEQQALNPGFYQRMTRSAEQPRSYQEDLSKQLSSISERFHSIGISLGAFGSELSSVALTPIIGLLDVAQTLLHVFGALLSPLSEATHVFASLPGPLRDVVGMLVALRVIRGIAGSRWGGAAQSFVGRLPGLSAFGSQDREIVDDSVSRMRNYVLPSQRQAAENALARARSAQENVQFAADTAATHAGSNQEFALAMQRFAANPQDPQRPLYEQNPAYLAFQERATNLDEELAQARQQAAAAERQAQVRRRAYLATRDVDLPTLQGQGPGEGMSYGQRAQYAQRIGMVAQQDDNTAIAELTAQRAALVNAIRSGTQLQDELNVVTEAAIRGEAPIAAGAGGTSRVAAGASAAEVGAVTAASMRAAAQNQGGIDDITQAVGRSQARSAAPQQQRQEQGRPPITGFADAGYAAGAAITDAQRRVMDRISLPESMVGWGGMGLVDATRELPARLSSSLKDMAMGPMGPLAGMMGAQLLAPVLPGALSREVSGPLTSGFMGMMVAQMMGRGPLGMALGFTAGNILGAAQQGTAQGVGSVAGAGVGAAVGGALGTLTDLFDFGTGTFIGAGLGSAAGGFIGNLLGGGGNTSTTLQDHATRAVRTAQRAVAGANALDPNGGFLSQFTNALILGGNAGSNAQSQASSQLQQLQAEQLLFGPNSVTGRQAQQLSASAIMATIQNAQSNPAAAYQSIQAADQSRQTVIQNQFKYGLATSRPGQEWKVFATAQQQYANEIKPYASAVGQAQQNLTDTQGELNSAIKTGNQKLIDQQRQAVKDAVAQLAGAQGVYQYEQQARGLNVQQAAQAAYQTATTRIQATGGLAQARAGGSVVAQAQAQIATANQLMHQATLLRATDPQQAGVDYQNALAQRAQGYYKIRGQGLTTLQAQGALSEAQVFTGDPIGQARVNMQNLQAQWQYMKQHAKAFDPSQIIQAQAAVVASEQQYAQTISDVNTEMIQLATQAQQAGAYGNAAAQAAYGIAGAYRQLAAARTPPQHAQALANLRTAQAQGFQASSQVVQEQSQLAQAQLSGDPVAQAASAVTYAKRLLAVAHGIDNQRQAEANLATAQYAYQQAIEQRDVALGQLAASTEVNPAQQLAKQLVGIAKALKAATKPADRIQLQTQLNSTAIQYKQSLAQTAEDTINFQFQMMQISSGQAVDMITKILKTNKDLTYSMRQQLQEQRRQYELGLITPIGGNQFDIAPGNVRLPTYYDVAHGVTGQGISAVAIHHNPQTTINVYVKDHKDVPKVADALDRATGSTVKRRLRQAKVTA